MKMKLSDIIITKSFKASTPKESKVRKYRDYWNANEKQLKYIVVDHNNILRDGYIQYLVLKENGVNEAVVKRKYHRNKSDKPIILNYNKNTETTYVYGKHPNSECDKEYIWRIPSSQESKLIVDVGDTVLCQTKFGLSPVVVSRVEVLDKCPVEHKVKRVVCKVV